MTGQPKNENLPEISQADEWFDLDRSEEMYEDGEWSPDDIVHDDFGLDIAERCPRCGSLLLSYKGEAYDDEEHLGSAYECEECGHNFDETDFLTE